jgi:cysteinyl-tRNA synthetase
LYSVLHNSGYRQNHACSIDEPDAPPVEVFDALCDDLNTPMALAGINALAKQLADAPDNESKEKITNQLLTAGRMLGVLQQNPESWLGYGAGGQDAEIDALLAERQQARKDKNFARSDQIRDHLAAKGIVIEDTPTGPKWKHMG